MIRRGTVGDGMRLDGTANQIVDEGTTLRPVLEHHRRGENVIVHQIRPMTHFNHEVTDVIVEHIARDARALRLPIHPHAQRAVVDVVVGNDRIQCGMEFDASDLPSEEFTLQRNVMDMVMLDTAECAAHMSDDGILSTLVDVVVAYDMTADQPLFPADATGLEHGLQLVLVTGLALGFRPLVVAG